MMINKTASKAKWTKGLGLLVHNEVWCVGGWGFNPQPWQYTRGVFHPARITSKVFFANMPFYLEFIEVASHVKQTCHFVQL